MADNELPIGLNEDQRITLPKVSKKGLDRQLSKAAMCVLRASQLHDEADAEMQRFEREAGNIGKALRSRRDANEAAIIAIIITEVLNDVLPRDGRSWHEEISELKEDMPG
jgi:hypothetical protein